MKASQSSARSFRSDGLEQLNETEALLLERVADQLVRFGQLAGVTPEEMVSLLDSDISIHGLVAFLASKRSGVA